MRISILLIALTGILAFSPADAKPDKGQRAENVRACDMLKGTTRGLHGLCVAYCAQRDLSKVDLNYSASIKAASPDISILRKYNERKRPYDPAMPCHKNSDPPDDPPDDPTPPDDPPDDPPPASNCLCWTGEELAAIDGVLIESSLGPMALECAGTAISEQSVEGYTLFFGGISPEGLAFATVDDNEAFYACRYIRTPNTDPDSTLEVRDVLFTIERADAQACQTEIVNHCVDMSQ